MFFCFSACIDLLIGWLIDWFGKPIDLFIGSTICFRYFLVQIVSRFSKYRIRFSQVVFFSHNFLSEIFPLRIITIILGEGTLFWLLLAYFGFTTARYFCRSIVIMWCRNSTHYITSSNCDEYFEKIFFPFDLLHCNGST